MTTLILLLTLKMPLQWIIQNNKVFFSATDRKEHQDMAKYMLIDQFRYFMTLQSDLESSSV